MKIERLMGIVLYLLNHGRTSAQKLAEEFEVSPRTIMRDLSSLDQAGIPIQSFSGVEGGYQIMDGYVLEKQVAAHDEYDWIATALKGLASAYANKTLERTLAKIQNLNDSSNHSVAVDFSVASEDLEINSQLKLLESAIKNGNVVQFSYTNSHDEMNDITVEPVRLQYKWYSWYLIGYCVKHKDYRMFKLVRMEHIKITNSKNTRTHTLSDISLQSADQHILNIRIYGKSSIKSKCKEYLHGQVTKEYENGDFEFCFSVPEHETFWYGVLLSFGSKAKVIEPEELKERILKTCQEMKALYSQQC